MDANDLLYWSGWGFFVWGLVELYQGRAHDKWRWRSREDEPRVYWMIICIRFFMALFFWFGVYYRKTHGIV